MDILYFIMGHSLNQSSATAYDWFRLSATLTQLTRLHPTAVLAMSKSILIVWTSGHRGLSGNKLSDHQAILGAAEIQSNNTLEPATQRALIRHSCHPLPIQHERLKEVYTCLSLMSRSKRPLPRPNAPTGLASAVVVSLLFDTGGI